MIEVADQRVRIGRKLRRLLVIVEAVFLDSAEQLVLRRKVVVDPPRENIVSPAIRRIKKKSGSVQAISEAGIISRRVTAVYESQKCLIRPHALRVDRLQLRG